MRVATYGVTLSVSLLLLVGIPSRASGQIGPMCPSGCLGGVQVTPDGGTESHPGSSGPWTVEFLVLNTSATKKTFTFSCSPTGGVSCVSVIPSSKALNPDQSWVVELTYNLGATGGQAGLLATASGVSDDGYYIVTIAPAPGAPAIALKNHNGDNVDRGLCLTTGGAEASAIQCGDLLVAHAMPAYETMGRGRSLTLLYNSATADPRPRVAAWITLPANVAQPDSVYAELQIAGVKRASAWYTSWSSTNPVRQIVLAAPLDTTSGIYAFTLLVRHQYTTGTYDAQQTGSLMIVNRRNSEFGAGWWLAGVEQLITGQSGNKMLWVGGDGSSAVYDSIAPGVWRRALGGFRDSLSRFDSSGTWYRRTLRHRVKVTFNSAGRHVRTTNRLGHSTTFAWALDTIKTITVPPAGQPATSYTLTYVTGAKLLDKITDPAGRILDATMTGGNLSGLTDPDGMGVTFAYDATRRLTGRTNRRGFTTSYTYANGVRVTRVQAPLSSQIDLGTTDITHWDERGLGVGNMTGRLTPADTSLAFTQVDGPRTDVADVAKFWVDRFGAPARIQDPVANTTVLTRGDATNPTLVTRVAFPNGQILGAGYDARANLTFVADSTFEGTGTTQTVVTTYVYGNAAVPDSPTEIRTPVDTTRFHYDTALGLPDTATAPGARRTAFEYFTTAAKKGLLYRVTDLGIPVIDTTAWTESAQNLVTTFGYDGWGNDSTVSTPKGALTRYERDSYRRITRAWDPLSHRTDYGYDVLNRTTLVSVLDSVLYDTRYHYSSAGAIDSVVAPRRVKRSWGYDAADRPTQMTDDAGNTAMTYYGRSGLVDSVRMRNGHVIRHRYDAAGRLIATTYPAAVNTMPDSSLSATLPGDSIVRTYDAAGRLLTAKSSRDTLIRTYNREGSLRTERQVLLDLTGSGVASDFTLRYWYDGGGRRTKFFTGTDTLRYTYGGDGQLVKLSVQWTTGQPADSFLFYWDAAGRRDSIIYSLTGGPATVAFGYDQDGHLRSICARHAHDPAISSDYFVHRVRYTALNADGSPLSTVTRRGGTDNPACSAEPSAPNETAYGTFEYDARHQMLRDGTKRYTYDSSGNRLGSYWVSSGTLVDSLQYASATNRVWKSFLSSGALNRTFTFDLNGSRTVETPTSTNWRLYYYNSVAQMTGHKAYVFNGSSWSWVGMADRCRYDVLGRRVYSCDESGGGWAGFDGDNAIRRKAAYATPQWRWVHGPGLDDPLVGIHNNGANYTKYYYMTDGGGRFLAFTEEHGWDRSTDLVYTQNGGNQSGSIAAAQSFGNTRMESASAPKLSFYRNRYYDQETGQFTQEDPIGLAGGINLYQYAGNNPAAYTDPFGLSPDTVKVGCRALQGILGVVGNHCAVRVDTDDGQSQVGELLKGDDGNNNVVVWNGQSSSSANYTWTTVAVPQGMTSAQFDQAVIGSFNQNAQEKHGEKYTSHSKGNSNRFVFDVITNAGGKVPQSAVPKNGLTPGLCGGGGRFATGNQCSPQ